MAQGLSLSSGQILMSSATCWGDELTHLTVLAANNTGYQNLTLLISKAYQRGYGAAGPIIDRDWLIELNEGLILLSGGAHGRRRTQSFAW
ncbi:DNA polymerase III subunit alpha [Escherichia coli]|uniref:DNA polymerase III subunit alpha n=1 Tax=Escherichia coli TaxID=562 RepID=A0A377DHI3_ECOLX|nr:DNA polymerase III subunit alpha [Escherichia coli]